MAEFRKILFPIDFSPFCEAVVPHVAAMAHRYNSRVTVLNVLEFAVARHFGFEPPRNRSPREIEEMREEHRTSLDAFVRQHFGQIDVCAAAVEGEPAQVITATAATDGTELIMMPTRGAAPTAVFCSVP